MKTQNCDRGHSFEFETEIILQPFQNKGVAMFDDLFEYSNYVPEINTFNDFEYQSDNVDSTPRYLEYELTPVYITSYSVSGAGGDLPPPPPPSTSETDTGLFGKRHWLFS